MKVKELVAMLAKTDPESLVILSKDEEGNGYLPVSNIEEARFTRKWGNEGEIAYNGSGEKAVVIWPLHM
jgi:hypothetical protein